MKIETNLQLLRPWLYNAHYKPIFFYSFNFLYTRNLRTPTPFLVGILTIPLLCVTRTSQNDGELLHANLKERKIEWPVYVEQVTVSLRLIFLFHMPHGIAKDARAASHPLSLRLTLLAIKFNSRSFVINMFFFFFSQLIHILILLCGERSTDRLILIDCLLDI